jgi:soluble lytic murein transglycosylase-like protein
MAAFLNGRRAAWLLAIALFTGAVHGQDALPAAYRLAGATAGVPPDVLFAVALQESGLKLHGKLIPWPWTLNVAGEPFRFQNRRTACAALRAALVDTPATRVDVGLAQINVGYHAHRVGGPCDLLDPYRNLEIAATILREQHESSEDWLLAAGRYHRPAGGAPAARYRQGVQQHLQALDRSRSPHSKERQP